MNTLHRLLPFPGRVQVRVKGPILLSLLGSSTDARERAFSLPVVVIVVVLVDVVVVAGGKW